jgi:AcrR family transcriptional regulator
MNAKTTAKIEIADSQLRYKEERRQLLMDSAAAVIAYKGLRSTTMDDIAASLDMTKIVLYRTFGTKDKLIDSILERITEEFLSVDALQIKEYGDRLHRYLDISRQYEDSMRILLLLTPYDEKYNKPYKKLNAQLIKRMMERIKQRQKTGETECGLDNKFVSESIVSFVLVSISRWLKHGKRNQDSEFVQWMLVSRAVMENPGMVPVERRGDT